MGISLSEQIFRSLFCKCGTALSLKPRLLIFASESAHFVLLKLVPWDSYTRVQEDTRCSEYLAQPIRAAFWVVKLYMVPFLKELSMVGIAGNEISIQILLLIQFATTSKEVTRWTFSSLPSNVDQIQFYRALMWGESISVPTFKRQKLHPNYLFSRGQNWQLFPKWHTIRRRILYLSLCLSLLALLFSWWWYGGSSSLPLVPWWMSGQHLLRGQGISSVGTEFLDFGRWSYCHAMRSMFEPAEYVWIGWAPFTSCETCE